MSEYNDENGDDSLYRDTNNVIEEEPFDEYGNTIKGSEMNDLNTRHEQLANEVDKIKMMFN